MASVETTGPTVDDAIDAALEKLDLDEDQVELEILSEGGDGQPARVRATPRSEIGARVDRAAEAARRGRGRVGRKPGDRRARDRRGPARLHGLPGRSRRAGAGKENGTPTLTLAVVDGESMGALIGRRGETLQAFQFITQLLVNRRLGHWTRVLLDIEGYRSRRERYLKDTALRAAEKAMRYRDQIELDPMIPSERRIVHLTLAEHEFVTTHSEGEGDNRRVIVEATPDYVAQHGGPPSAPSGRRGRAARWRLQPRRPAAGGGDRARRLRRWRWWRPRVVGGG